MAMMRGGQDSSNQCDTMKHPQSIFIRLIFAFLFVARSAEAVPVRSQKHCGTVESIDLRAGRLAIACQTHNHAGQVRLPGWRSVAPATALKRGDKACVYFRQPFFGRPVATKVVARNP